ncbi:MAG: HNH endonuclease signature motif containing protein [Polyangiaceae bacterium]
MTASRSVVLADGNTRSWSWARKWVRDHHPHVCSDCALDLEDVATVVRLSRRLAPVASKRIRDRWLLAALEDNPNASADAVIQPALWKYAALEMLGPYGFLASDLDRRRFWDVDHIKPVAIGGGHCRLDNLRCLCIPCHRQVTGAFNHRRVRKGRGPKHRIPSRPFPRGKRKLPSRPLRRTK